jgi:phosphomannomutase
MKSCLARLKAVADIGFVGGSDQKKIREQLDEDTIQLSNYFFSENGLLAYRGSELIGREVEVGAFRPSRISWGSSG